MWGTLPPTKKPAKVGTSHLFYGTSGGTDVTALVSLGDAFEAKKGDARREIVRKAVGSGVKSIKVLREGISEAFIDASTDPHAAGELLDASYVGHSRLCRASNKFFPRRVGSLVDHARPHFFSKRSSTGLSQRKAKNNLSSNGHISILQARWRYVTIRLKSKR